jgi:hypothetical protein
MANITLTIPDELHEKLKSRSEIRWSELMRKILSEKIAEFESMEKLVSESKLTFDDAKQISEKVDKNVAKKFSVK